MTAIKAAILGFGTVGQGIQEIIQSQQSHLNQLLGAPIEICAVLVDDLKKSRSLPSSIKLTDQIEEVLAEEPDVVFEAIVGEEPGYTYLTRALEKDCHIITANKVMFDKHGPSLLSKAQTLGLGVGYEATTASGTPIIGTLEKLLQVNQVERLEAILNGTSNYIVTAMQEDGVSFEEALQEAQQLGYAEADPTQDIEGLDAFAKLMILSQIIYNDKPKTDHVVCKGITGVTDKDIYDAKTQGRKIRHIASLEKQDGEIIAKVEPVSLEESHGLYAVDGVDNAITLTTNLIGSLTLRGPGAGKLATSSAMVEDFVHILQTYPVKQLQ